MQISEGAPLNEVESEGVVFFAFAWEPGDDVGADARVRQMFANQLDAARVMFASIPAVHGGENCVRATLQWHVKVLCQPRCGREKQNEVAGNVQRLNRTEAQALDRRFVENLPEQVDEVAARRKITAPGCKVDAAQNDLLVTGIRQLARFLHHGFWGQAAALPAHEGNHAEGAAVAAAVLNLECRSSAMAFAAQNR